MGVADLNPGHMNVRHLADPDNAVHGLPLNGQAGRLTSHQNTRAITVQIRARKADRVHLDEDLARVLVLCVEVSGEFPARLLREVGVKGAAVKSEELQHELVKVGQDWASLGDEKLLDRSS